MPRQPQHWWRCDGPCRMRSPLFGWVRRETNRAPGPGDSWWPGHSCTCGGRFVKVKEPVDYTMKRVKGLLSHGGCKVTVNNVTFDLASSVEPSEPVIDLSSSYSPPRASRLNRHRSTRHVWGAHPVIIDLTSLSQTEFVSRSHQREKRHLSTISILGNQPIIDLTSQDFHRTNFIQHTKDLTASRRVEATNERIIINSLTECPMCMKQMTNEVLSEHLKGCGDLQLLNEEESIEIGATSRGSQGKDETESCVCPLCSKVLKGSVQEHLRECDGVQGIFDDDVIDGEVKTDDPRELYLKAAQGSIINNMPNSLRLASLCTKITGKFTQCPICMKGVLKEALPKHLKECDDLQNLLGEDVIYSPISKMFNDSQGNKSTQTCCSMDSKALEGCINDRLRECGAMRVFGNDNFGVSKKHDVCPLCLKDVQCDLSLHISTCVASNMIDDNLEEKAKGTGNKETCTVCEEVLQNISLKDHLQNCEGLQGIFDNNITENLVSDNCIVDDVNSTQTTFIDSNTISQHIPHKKDIEKLIFCRGCAHFYSVINCPTCCINKK